MFTRDKNRRQKILEFIRNYTAEHNFAPSVREIGKALGIRSTRAVQYHLNILITNGMLERCDRRARTLRTAHQPDSLPLVGRIAAGAPLLAVENIESRVTLERFRDCFLLRVQGESMTDAGILDGDMVIVRPQATAEHGAIVAALLDNEATVKRFERNGDTIILRPENPRFQPITIQPGRTDFSIIGVVVGLLRDYR